MGNIKQKYSKTNITKNVKDCTNEEIITDFSPGQRTAERSWISGRKKEDLLYFCMSSLSEILSK